MRRREFVAGLCGAAAWPLAARAQPAATSLIGYVHPAFHGPNAHLAAIFRKVLAEVGYVEGRNIAIEYRFAEGQYDQLPAMVADLVRRQVALIVAPNTPAALAAKAGTTTIPIVFSTADDPVNLNLVASLARPGGNVTGVYYFNTGLAAKQLGLLRELIPRSARFGLLINPANTNAEAVQQEVKAAASAIGLEIDVVAASDRAGIEAAFATLVQKRVDALLIGADPFFYGRRLQLATLALRHALPTVYNSRDYTEVGGLMAYGGSLREVYRHLGVYTGHILKGAKPSDLPVVQSTTFDFVINLSTARALALEVPPPLLARADEVIE
jgi:putative tryptophan/tyrosine transport system substrate-binding protein